MDRPTFVLHISLMQWDQFPASLTKLERPSLYQCEANWSWTHRRFQDFDLWIVLDGEGHLTINAEPIAPLQRGHGVLFRPGDSVRAEHNPDTPLHVFAVHFQPTPHMARALRAAVPRFLRFHDLNHLRSEITDLLTLGNQADDNGGLERVYLTKLLATAGRDTCSAPPDPVDLKLRQIAQEIASRPGDTWTAPALARSAGLSISHFNRRFRRTTGASLARYVISRRIDRARRLLRETPLSLGEVADALGYADIYYLQRQFRAETGSTPGQYRAG